MKLTVKRGRIPNRDTGRMPWIVTGDPKRQWFESFPTHAEAMVFAIKFVAVAVEIAETVKAWAHDAHDEALKIAHREGYGEGFIDALYDEIEQGRVE